MPQVGFEPTISAGERPQTHALDRAATGTGHLQVLASNSHRCDKPCRKDISCSGFSHSWRIQRIVWREVNTDRRNTTAAKLRGLKYAAYKPLAARHFFSYSPFTVLILVTACGLDECLRILSIQKRFSSRGLHVVQHEVQIINTEQLQHYIP